MAHRPLQLFADDPSRQVDLLESDAGNRASRDLIGKIHLVQRPQQGCRQYRE